MSMAYIRKTYGVPAKRGGRVRYTGGPVPEFGTIVRSNGAYLNIRMDGAIESYPFHPTWELEYLVPTPEVPR